MFASGGAAGEEDSRVAAATAGPGLQSVFLVWSVYSVYSVYSAQCVQGDPFSKLSRRASHVPPSAVLCLGQK